MLHLDTLDLHVLFIVSRMVHQCLTLLHNVVVVSDGRSQFRHQGVRLQVAGQHSVEGIKFGASHFLFDFLSCLETVVDHLLEFVFHVEVGRLANIENVEVLGDLGCEMIWVLSLLD